MCSIMGWQGVELPEEIFRKYLEKTTSRGPDMERIRRVSEDILLGFERLSIMGITEAGMQPFSLGKNLVVCNGEIYGFRKIKEELESEYTFMSDSDCEILLPMYEKYGVELFEQLDAEFACIIYDDEKKSLVAARDPIGIRPLFYGYVKQDYDNAKQNYGNAKQEGNKEGIVFASEAKNLVGLVDEIKPFPPGYYYADGKFVCYKDATKVTQVIDDDIDTICAQIKQKLIDGVAKRLDSDTPVGFLLSGGLDSSLVCSISAKILKKPIKTFAIGMNTDAIDLKYAKEVAEYIGSDHTEVIITKEDVIKALPEVIALLGTYDITTIRASMGMYLVCKAIHEQTDIKVILTGEISDELFGYKYTDFAPDALSFQKEAEKRIREIYMYDVLRADRCISSNSLEARVPFGDLKFVDYVMSIDPKLKMNTYGIGKYLLRHAFEGNYLPQSILMREKAAFSDAVGHSMVDDLKAYANDYYTDEEYEKLRKKYEFATPFTKESLLYRELFETYYKGQAPMVADFWMPNKSWEGCNVDDPSARVLSNYGESGV
ncbi:Asparagine synthetase [Lachnospiraceae bacterium TWA4]|nr:Asparagine synthetase [Lachnospiraceae bacterium TWA4]